MTTQCNNRQLEPENNPGCNTLVKDSKNCTTQECHDCQDCTCCNHEEDS